MPEIIFLNRHSKEYLMRQDYRLLETPSAPSSRGISSECPRML